MIRTQFKYTLRASFIGYIVQAIVNNFAPLLFLTFQRNYGISLERIAFLVTLNFGIQLCIDLLASKFATKIGYRNCIVFAHFAAAAGLIGMTIFPEIFRHPYWGLLLATVLYAVGGGLLEVLISPIVEACPSEKKEAQMSLLHSFYCWGQCLVVLLSTLFFAVFEIKNWKIMALGWAILPLVNGFLFTQVPIRTLEETRKEKQSTKRLFQNKLFWLLLLIMFGAGATELAMSQWASAFAEEGLGVSKTVGDLAGPCTFALLMGLARLLYAKHSHRIKLEQGILCSSLLGIAGYLIAALASLPIISLMGCALCGAAAGILWPGTYSIAAKELPMGGTAMFALLALAGDLGCAAGPTLVGLVSDAANGNLKTGLLTAIFFPALLTVGISYLIRKKKTKNRQEI